MNVTAANVFIALIVVQVIGTVAYLVQVVELFARLRKNCPAVYESLGSPSLVFNNTPKNNMLFLGWLWRRDFDVVGDADTAHKAAVVRVMLLALLSNMALLFVTFATFGIVHNA